MSPATPVEITELVGDIDPIAVEQILELGATTDEVAQAVACLEAERAGEVRVPITTRVAAVYSILDDAFEARLEESYPAVG